jgi:hypothetical protein
MLSCTFIILLLGTHYMEAVTNHYSLHWSCLYCQSWSVLSLDIPARLFCLTLSFMFFLAVLDYIGSRCLQYCPECPCLSWMSLYSYGLNVPICPKCPYLFWIFESIRIVQCCGSEPERIPIFWLDPNKKKSSYLDSDPDTVVKQIFLWKIADQTLEREKTEDFQLEIFFFLCRTDSRTHIKAMRGTILKIFGSKY